MIINCVAIPDTLLESELFGYEKGAFTGATQRRIGKIEQANHGAVFLDEIGDMPVNIQAKILRLLQEKKIERLGGRETIDVDVRIIAATNRDLEAAVAEGAFREDLYYRLKVVTLTIPPLRDRKEDIPQLANYFLRRFARDMDMDNPGLTKEALEALMEYNWPGNVRELANALQKTLVFSRGGALGGPDVLKAVGDSKNGSCPLAPYSPDGPLRDWVRSCLAAPGDSAFDTCMDQIGRLVIREALEITDGNRTRAAKLLGLSRPTLLAKIEKYGLRIKAQIS
jgi:two-component system NtrC family response regulator/two-component system nitrogen regulation response regulator GlnG